jgi:cholesterol transport system auxiliary component
VTLSRSLAVLAAATLSLGLGGCISVFPKATPAQLYTFGVTMPATHAANAGAPAFNVMRAVTAFAPESAGDRILTMEGQRAAYIAASRWVSPASVLFDAAETRAFDADDGPARLIRRGEIAGAPAELRLEVQTFEVSYHGAAPTVVIEVRAVLVGLNSRQVIDTKTFASHQTVSDNRVGEIVQGFDAATIDVLGQIVAWTDSQAGAVGTAKGL